MYYRYKFQIQSNNMTDETISTKEIIFGMLIHLAMGIFSVSFWLCIIIIGFILGYFYLIYLGIFITISTTNNIDIMTGDFVFNTTRINGTKICNIGSIEGIMYYCFYRGFLGSLLLFNPIIVILLIIISSLAINYGCNIYFKIKRKKYKKNNY